MSCRESAGGGCTTYLTTPQCFQPSTASGTRCTCTTLSKLASFCNGNGSLSPKPKPCPRDTNNDNNSCCTCASSCCCCKRCCVRVCPKPRERCPPPPCKPACTYRITKCPPPPVIILNDNKAASSPAARLQSVEVEEELVYYPPAPTPACPAPFDCYDVCRGCGGIEYLPACCPLDEEAPPVQPISYTRRQSFSFQDPAKKLACTEIEPWTLRYNA
jgi:hypothetical protein